AIRDFNRLKNSFFRDKKREKVDNLNQKIKLIERAEAILTEETSGQFRKEVIRLQDEWKKIGPVPPKYSEKIWKQFIATCDSFFKKLNEQHGEQKKEMQENLRLKNELIEKVKQLADEDKPEDLQGKIRQFQDDWASIGFVPFKEKDKIRKEFFDSLNVLISKVRGKTGDRGGDRLEYSARVQNWANEDPRGGRLQQEERKLQRDLKHIEGEISTLENNMAFFKNSKSADVFKDNIEKQIDQLRQKMKEFQEKLQVIRKEGSASNR
ncbi:MAG: DUF349 domain-containing protein, partial [Bacteroidota bacterium]|nr:DUF349 domain-containing protein [Bacteroidota bacterium]